MKKKFRWSIVIVIAVGWLAIAFIDFLRVHSFEKPIFCIGAKAADDGGSGHYVGLGYSFDIEGNFMPEDEFPGVTRYDGYIFGMRVFFGVRD